MSAKPNNGLYQGKRMTVPFKTATPQTGANDVSFNRTRRRDARKASLVPWVALATWLSACGLAAPQRGTPLSPTAALATFEVRGHSTDLIPVRVIFPSNVDGTPKPGPFPAVIYIQGGFVAPSRYFWQGQALAEAGYVVAFPEHPNALAFFAQDNGLSALNLLSQPPRGSLLEGLVDANKVAVAGHSLGGVVTVKLALSKRFKAFMLQASLPDSADKPALPTLEGTPSLSLQGTLDCSATPASVSEGWKLLPSPTALVKLEGATHYQFTDSQKEDDERKCVPTKSIAETHARLVDVMTTFLSTAMATGTIDGAALGPSAEVTTR